MGRRRVHSRPPGTQQARTLQSTPGGHEAVPAPGAAPAVRRVVGLRAAGQAGLARHNRLSPTLVLLRFLSLLVLLLSAGGAGLAGPASLALGAPGAVGRGRAPAAPLPRRGRLARQLLRQLALQRLDLGKRARRQSPYPTRMPTLILPYGRPSPPAAPSARPSAPQPGRPRGASETAIPKLRGGASEGPELKSAACFQGLGLPAPAGRTALPRWCGPARQLTSISPSSATRAPSVRRVAFHMRGRHLPDCRGSWAPPRLPQQARSQPSTHARRPGSAYPCSVAPVRNWAVSGS